MFAVQNLPCACDLFFLCWIYVEGVCALFKMVASWMSQ